MADRGRVCRERQGEVGVGRSREKPRTELWELACKKEASVKAKEEASTSHSSRPSKRVPALIVQDLYQLKVSFGCLRSPIWSTSTARPKTDSHAFDHVVNDVVAVRMLPPPGDVYFVAFESARTRDKAVLDFKVRWRDLVVDKIGTPDWEWRSFVGLFRRKREDGFGAAEVERAEAGKTKSRAPSVAGSSTSRDDGRGDRQASRFAQLDRPPHSRSTSSRLEDVPRASAWSRPSLDDSSRRDSHAPQFSTSNFTPLPLRRPYGPPAEQPLPVDRRSSQLSTSRAEDSSTAVSTPTRHPLPPPTGSSTLTTPSSTLPPAPTPTNLSIVANSSTSTNPTTAAEIYPFAFAFPSPHVSLFAPSPPPPPPAPIEFSRTHDEHGRLLPEGWKTEKSRSNGDFFYIDPAGQTTWDTPCGASDAGAVGVRERATTLEEGEAVDGRRAAESVADSDEVGIVEPEEVRVVDEQELLRPPEDAPVPSDSALSPSSTLSDVAFPQLGADDPSHQLPCRLPPSDHPSSTKSNGTSRPKLPKAKIVGAKKPVPHRQIEVRGVAGSPAPTIPEPTLAERMASAGEESSASSTSGKGKGKAKGSPAPSGTSLVERFGGESGRGMGDGGRGRGESGRGRGDGGRGRGVARGRGRGGGKRSAEEDGGQAGKKAKSGSGGGGGSSLLGRMG